MEEYICVNDLLKMDDNEIVLVSRILIKSELILCNINKINNVILKNKLEELLALDERTNKTNYGIQMTISDIKNSICLTKLHGNSHFKKIPCKTLKLDMK